MPHVIVKLQSGRSRAQKEEIAQAVTRAVMASAKCSEAAISVSIEDVAVRDWTATVYNPDILQKPDTLYKKPSYDPL
jgi:4-oxalocrotonate tautomerase